LLATLLLSGLAAGALCCLLALLIKRDATVLLLPFALAIGWLMQWQGYRGMRGAVTAAAATLVCVAYTQYLYAAVRIADMLGFPLRNTLFKMDFDLAWQMIRANFSAWGFAIVVLAPLLAASVAACWPPRLRR
jgi:hypothetical protein